MGLFKKKKDASLKQNLDEKSYLPGSICPIHLFMEEWCDVPEKGRVTEVFEDKFGDIDIFSYDENVIGISVKKYISEFKEGNVPPMLMITNCTEAKDYQIDEIALSQMCACPEHEEILNRCRYHVIATDMMTAGLSYKDHADILMDYMEALLELYPSTEAVLFDNSKKMFSKESILSKEIPKEDRFIYYAVNVRFFNIQGTDDMLVDTIGMSTICLPDLQYHFHGMEPNWVVNHAYNVLSYIYQGDSPIKNGDTIDGIIDGKMNQQIQWKCRYEDSLIQPIRPVIDINMGDYASGKRR